MADGPTGRIVPVVGNGLGRVGDFQKLQVAAAVVNAQGWAGKTVGIRAAGTARNLLSRRVIILGGQHGHFVAIAEASNRRIDEETGSSTKFDNGVVERNGATAQIRQGIDKIGLFAK